MTEIEWEDVPTTNKGKADGANPAGEVALYRARVHGGWLVMAVTRNFAGYYDSGEEIRAVQPALTFIPAGSGWDGE